MSPRGAPRHLGHHLPATIVSKTALHSWDTAHRQRSGRVGPAYDRERHDPPRWRASSRACSIVRRVPRQIEHHSPARIPAGSRHHVCPRAHSNSIGSFVPVHGERIRPPWSTTICWRRASASTRCPAIRAAFAHALHHERCMTRVGSLRNRWPAAHSKRTRVLAFRYGERIRPPRSATASASSRDRSQRLASCAHGEHHRPCLRRSGVTAQRWPAAHRTRTFDTELTYRRDNNSPPRARTSSRTRPRYSAARAGFTASAPRAECAHRLRRRPARGTMKERERGHREDPAHC